MASKIDPLHDSLSHLDLKPGYTHTLHVLKTYVGSESKKEGFICDLLTDKHPSNLKKKPSFGFIVLLQADWRKADTVFFSSHITPHLRHRRREVVLSRVVHRNLSRVVIGGASRCRVILSRCSRCRNTS